MIDITDTTIVLTGERALVCYRDMTTSDPVPLSWKFEIPFPLSTRIRSLGSVTFDREVTFDIDKPAFGIGLIDEDDRLIFIWAEDVNHGDQFRITPTSEWHQ